MDPDGAIRNFSAGRVPHRRRPGDEFLPHPADRVDPNKIDTTFQSISGRYIFKFLVESSDANGICWIGEMIWQQLDSLQQTAGLGGLIPSSTLYL